MTRRRLSGGGVLAVVVLVLVALSLAAHGALLLAGQELAAAHAAGRLLQARMAAEEALLTGSSSLPPAASADTPLWSSAEVAFGTNGAGAYRAVSIRLSRETWLLEGWGRVPPQDWTARVARLVWRLEPAARVAAFHGVVETAGGSTVTGGQSIGSDIRSDSNSLFCRPSREVLDSVLTGSSLPTVHRLAGSDSAGSGLAHLTWVDLAELLPALPAGPATPRPHESLGRCVTGDPWGWGDPDDSRGPCAANFVAAVAPADLRLEGGRGQGLLVVRGDLEMIGTRFGGLVLVEGRLTLRQGASITGFSRGIHGVELDGGSQILGSACRAFRALDAARHALGRLVEIGDLGPLVPPG